MPEGTTLSLFSAVKDMAKRTQEDRSHTRALRRREALRVFEFSNETVDNLQRLKRASTQQELEQLVGELAMARSHTHADVGDAFAVFAELQNSQDEKLSADVRDTLEAVLYGKKNAKQLIASVLHDALSSGSRSKIPKLVDEVLSLNNEIKHLDGLLAPPILKRPR